MKKIVNDYPVIDLIETGRNIDRLMKEQDVSKQELADYLGFSAIQGIYKWINGTGLPSLDSLYAMSNLFQVSMNDILVKKGDNHQNIA